MDYQFLGYDNNQNNVSQTAAVSFFNPKIGTTYSFSNKWILSGYAGVAHREPNRDDYTQSTPSSRPRPERLFDVETGLKKNAGNWNVSANAYYMGYKDQLVLDGRLNDVGAYIRTNVPESYRAGLELEAATRITSRLSVSANAAFSRNKVKNFVEYRDNWDDGTQARIEYNNTDLAFSPNIVARAEALLDVVQNTRQHLSLALSGKYVGKQYLDNTSSEYATLPGYFFSDLRLNWNLNNVVGKNLSVIFSVNNLFDQKYSSNGWVYRFMSAGYDPRPDDPYTRLEQNNVYHQAGFFPQAGRNLMGTVVFEL